MEDTPIRVLIVDDHAVVRMGLRAFFDLQDDIEVVGEAGDGSEGVALARRLKPDVVLMDLMMPNMDGLTAIARIKGEMPETEIVAMTSLHRGGEGHRGPRGRRVGLPPQGRRGRRGRRRRPRRLRRRGPPRSGRRPAARPADARTARPAEDEPVEPLTDREKDVIRLLGQGMSNKDIGAALFITERTARTYVSNILGKLGLASRTQAALWAVEHKLAEPARD